MEAASVPQKYLVRNNTAGWVGVVRLDHRGEEKGQAIEPFGSVWLTELEMICTARAPKLPEDNPFEEQTLLLTNPETGSREEFRVRPLSLERDGARYTPAEDRYVPTVGVPKEAVPAQTQERSVPSPTAETPASGAAVQPPPPPAAPLTPGPEMRRAVEPLRGAPAPPPEAPESWVQQPQAPGAVLAGRLNGSNEPAPDPEHAPEPSGPDERFVPSIVGAQAAPQTPGEEFAEAVDPAIGEETGQAKPPTQDPPQGEYARAEEVGSPDAPTNDETLVWEYEHNDA
jgi:hypothetical protein